MLFSHATLQPSIELRDKFYGKALNRKSQQRSLQSESSASLASDMMETDNAYFVIFDGHAGYICCRLVWKEAHLYP